MRLRTFALLCACLLLALLDVRAQDYLYATGSPVYSTTIPVDQGFINLNNGNLHLEIPLATKQQRGDLVLNEKLVYDSRMWKPVQSSGTTTWQPTNVPNSTGGWMFSSGLAAGSTAYNTQPHTDYEPCGGRNTSVSWVIYQNWTWTDPSGTTHAFPLANTVKYTAPSSCFSDGTVNNEPASTSYAADGSGYILQITNYTSATVTDVHGITYHPTACMPSGGCISQSSVVADRNGNTWNTDASGNLVDTSGTVPVTVSASGTQTFYDVLGVNGARNRYTVTMTTVNFSTNFGVGDTSGSFQAIQSIALPDGSSYQFGYDSGTSVGHFGNLTSMTLPAGGVIQYSYDTVRDAYGNLNRWLGSFAKDGSTTSLNNLGISGCSTSSGCQQQVLAIDNNTTRYTFNLDPTNSAGNSSWVSTIQRYQGSTTNGQLLETATTTYTYSGNTGGKVPVSVTNTTNFSGTPYQSQTTTAFAPDTGLPTEVKAWDFYTGPAPAPTTDTIYAYGARNFPTSVVVKDGAGHQLSSVTYGYDEAAPAASSGVPNHGAAAASPRGNRTSQHQWIDTTGQTLDTTMAYDDAGMLLSATAPNGTTRYSYDGTDTVATNTFLPTPSSGVELASGASYDGSTLAITSTTDFNGFQTAYKGFDGLNRPAEIDYPDGGKTTLIYRSPKQRAWPNIVTAIIGQRWKRCSTATGG